MLRVLTQDMATGSGNYNEGQNMGEAVLMVGFLGFGHLVRSVRWWRGSKGIFLWLGEVLSDNLSGLRGDPVRKTDRKVHNKVTALWRVLGKRQAFPSESLHRPWLDDVMTGERYDAVFQSGNANCAATQCLEEKRGKEIERVNFFIRKGIAKPWISQWVNVSMN